MALPEASAWAILIGVVLVAAVVGFRPLLARLAARNIGRRKSRVLIVVAGLLVGTAIISSSLVVGDTLSYIFLEDVYARLDAIDEVVSNTFNGQLFSFSETNFTQIRADLGTAGSPIDGIAPALLKIMPVRNVAGNKGNQQISVMGLNATLESGFGSLTTVDGRTVDTNDLAPTEVYANERAVADLNATAGQDLTLFYGTTNQTIVHATLAGVVRDAGKAGYEGRAILFMDLSRAQAAFNESGAINLIRVSNVGGVADGVAYSDRVTHDLRLSITTRNLALLVQTVKADDIASALQVGRDATDLFLVMGAFGILAGVLLIVNIFVMLAEERKPELGVARAVGFLRSDLLTTFALEGTFYAVVAAALGALAGLGLGYIMVYFFDKLVPHGDVVVTFHFDVSSIITAFVAGTALTWITILLASWRVSPLNIIRAVPGPPQTPTPERGRGNLVAGHPLGPEGEPRRRPARPQDRDLVSDGQALPHRDDRRDVRAHPVHGHIDLDAPRPPGGEPRFVRPAAVRRVRRDRVHDGVRRDPELPAAAPGKLQRVALRRRLEWDLERERDAGENPGRRRQSHVRLHALGRRQLPDPVEPVRLHELPAFLHQRIERRAGGPRDARAGLALPPVQPHAGDRGPLGRGPEPVRAGREPPPRGAGRWHPRLRRGRPHREPDNRRRPGAGPAIHVRGFRRPERRARRLPRGGAVHRILLPDGARGRRRRVPDGSRAHLLRVRPSDDRHPRADRAGLWRVAGGPHAHAGVPGDRAPRRDRGPGGDHAPSRGRAAYADRGTAGDRLHTGNGPGDVPRRDRFDRGPGDRDRGRAGDCPGVQDLHRVFRGHRRLQCAVAEPRINRRGGVHRGSCERGPTRDPRIPNPTGGSPAVHRVSPSGGLRVPATRYL